MPEYSLGRKEGGGRIPAGRVRPQRSASLTGGGDELEEQLLGEQGVLKTPEVQLQDPGYRVDVVVALIVHQGVLS